MKKKLIRITKHTPQIAALSALLLGITAPPAAFGGPEEIADDLAEARAATAQFHRIATALEAGYGLHAIVPGLDKCIQKPGVGAMGYHFFNLELIDDISLDPLRPEALVYAPGDDGRLHLAALEYIVPMAAWAAAGNTEPPTLLGMPLHPGPNPALGWYIIHLWVWKHNPAGMFEDWNPEVICP